MFEIHSHASGAVVFMAETKEGCWRWLYWNHGSEAEYDRLMPTVRPSSYVRPAPDTIRTLLLTVPADGNWETRPWWSCLSQTYPCPHFHAVWQDYQVFAGHGMTAEEAVDDILAQMRGEPARPLPQPKSAPKRHDAPDTCPQCNTRLAPDAMICEASEDESIEDWASGRTARTYCYCPHCGGYIKQFDGGHIGAMAR